MVPTERVSGGGLVLLLAAVVLVGVLILAAGGRRADRRGLPEANAETVRRRSEETDQQIRALFVRGDRKRVVTWELVAGRMTLLEAAARFRALDLAPPGFGWEGFRTLFKGETDEERHCREVIRWVESELDTEDHCLGMALSARLERELERHLRVGTLRLPEVPE